MGYEKCWLAEHKNQIEYSGAQNILNCSKTNNYLNNKEISIDILF